MNEHEFAIKAAGSLSPQTSPTWEDALNYGNVIAHMGREVTITDLYSDERHTVITNSTATPLDKLIVRHALGSARNDSLS